MKRIIIIALAWAVLAQPSPASVPTNITIQGVLTDDAGIPLPDGDYAVRFNLYDAAVGGTLMLSELIDTVQNDGVFAALLGIDFPYLAIFDQELWLEMMLDGESPMVPRVLLTATPVALRASTVDPANAVTGLNSQKGNLNIVAGPNVTVSTATGIITISASAGAGGDDGDWVMSGQNVYHDAGEVLVGLSPSSPKNEIIPPLRGLDDADKDPASSKMTVVGRNQGLYSLMYDDDTLADRRSAIFGRRYRQAQNNGIGFNLDGSNAAVTGFNDWGDSFTFGVSGYTWFDYNNTAGVMGAQANGTYWGALAFRDSSGASWGSYTPSNAHVGGLFETRLLRVKGGASAGYIMTSDASGNASWQAPGTAVADGDWTISGNNMFHATTGAVAIGTSIPHTWGDASTATTMQIKASFSPTLALDAQGGLWPNNGLYRWTMTGGLSGLKFNKSSDYASFGVTAMSIEEGAVEVKRFDGSTGIRLQGEGPMESGSKLEIYSTSTSTTWPTVLLDGQNNLGDEGGVLFLRDRFGQDEVIVTANHNGTSVGRVITPVLEITGGSDLSEQFDLGAAGQFTEPGMVVSIDPENPGHLTLSGQAYDRRVAGVISGAGGVNTGMVMGQRGTLADGELPVALVGRVYVWADASDGPIEPGDLLTTANRPGHAMKVTDHVLATGAILGKAMTGLKEGQGLILTLVTLQ